jgi:hypothetical protein
LNYERLRVHLLAETACCWSALSRWFRASGRSSSALLNGRVWIGGGRQQFGRWIMRVDASSYMLYRAWLRSIVVIESFVVDLCVSK